MQAFCGTLVFLCSFLATTVVWADGYAGHKDIQRFLQSLGITLYPTSAVTHNHLKGTTDRAAAEEDRLIAMLFVLECDQATAEHYFTYARRHDPANTEVIAAHALMAPYLAKKSKEIEAEAQQSEQYLADIQRSFLATHSVWPQYLLQLNQTKILYQEALRCDNNNASARIGFNRSWHKQHGDWTLLDRLGYHK